MSGTWRRLHAIGTAVIPIPMGRDSATPLLPAEPALPAAGLHGTPTASSTQDGHPQRHDDDAVRINERKWGRTVWSAGWTGIPTVLLDAQQRLGLTAQQLTVLLHLLKRWWTQDSLPYPSRADIAKSTGMSVRTVQRQIDELVSRGLVHRTRRRRNGGFTSNEYSFDGLLRELEPLAAEALEKREARRRAISEAGPQLGPAHGTSSRHSREA